MAPQALGSPRASAACSVDASMELSQGRLGILLAASALLGLCLGVVFDLLKLFRAFLDVTPPKHPRAHALALQTLRFWQDLFFMLASSWSLVILLYYTNDGQLRLLAVCGMACGFLLYRRTLGRLVSSRIPKVAAVLRRAVKGILTALLLPLLTVGRLAVLLWRCTGGKQLHRVRRKQTARRVEALVDSASRGFDLIPKNPQK